MRYIFIVHDKSVARFGKHRAEHLFYWLLGIVPIVIAIWLYFGAADRDFDGIPVINKCNGTLDKIFLLLRGFAEPRDVWAARCEKQNTNDETASAAEFLDLIQCRLSSLVFLLLLSNVFEGFIYCRTWTHILKT